MRVIVQKSSKTHPYPAVYWRQTHSIFQFSFFRAVSGFITIIFNFWLGQIPTERTNPLPTKDKTDRNKTDRYVSLTLDKSSTLDKRLSTTGEWFIVRLMVSTFITAKTFHSFEKFHRSSQNFAKFIKLWPPRIQPKHY